MKKRQKLVKGEGGIGHWVLIAKSITAADVPAVICEWSSQSGSGPGYLPMRRIGPRRTSSGEGPGALARDRAPACPQRVTDEGRRLSFSLKSHIRLTISLLLIS